MAKESDFTAYLNKLETLEKVVSQLSLGISDMKREITEGFKNLEEKYDTKIEQTINILAKFDYDINERFETINEKNTIKINELAKAIDKILIK